MRHRCTQNGGLSCGRLTQKRAASAVLSSARPAVSYIERSTRSLHTGNVESEKELHLPAEVLSTHPIPYAQAELAEVWLPHQRSCQEPDRFLLGNSASRCIESS